MTSKERAYLRSLANSIDTIFQIGKIGISDVFLSELDKAIEKRELIKISVLETAPANAKVLAQDIANNINCEVVQTMGNKITLFRKNKKKSKIVFPS